MRDGWEWGDSKSVPLYPGPINNTPTTQKHVFIHIGNYPLYTWWGFCKSSSENVVNSWKLCVVFNLLKHPHSPPHTAA